MPSQSILPEQALGLSHLASSGPVRVIAIASGKGGVGKSNLSVNLACIFARRRRSTMLLDADLGLANADVLLGVRSRCDLRHVVSGERSLEEILIEGPHGLKLVPAASGVQDMAQLEPLVHAGLIRAFGELSAEVDVLLVDTAAGINDSVISFSKAAQEVIVVACDEPTSITDAYALIKVLSRDGGVTRVQLIANMVRNASQGISLYNKLLDVTDRFLNVSLGYLGHIPFDECVHYAVRRRSPLVLEYPHSKACLAMQQIADRIEDLPMPNGSGGTVEFFLERMVGNQSYKMSEA